LGCSSYHHPEEADAESSSIKGKLTHSLTHSLNKNSSSSSKMNVIHSAAALEEKRLRRNKQAAADTKPSVNFYRESPHFELSLDDFEVFALKRLKVGTSLHECILRS